MMNVQLSESEFRTFNIAHSKFNIQSRLAFSLSLAFRPSRWSDFRASLARTSPEPHAHFCTFGRGESSWSSGICALLPYQFLPKMHLGEFARIVLPTGWAMCEVPWYGMVLIAHPHGYPHAVHIFCGHRKWGCQCATPLSPFPSRRLTRIEAKSLSERRVSAPTLTFVPLSKQMSAHPMKTMHAPYRCA